MLVPPTDAGAIELIVALTLRAGANKDALKAYGVDLSQLKNNELHADVLATLAYLRQREAEAAEAIKTRGIFFVEDKMLANVVADAGLDVAGRHVIRLSPTHLLAMKPADRKAVLLHEIAHVLLGHAAQMFDAPAKAEWLMHEAFEAEAWQLAYHWME